MLFLVRPRPELEQNFQTLRRREATVILAVSLVGFPEGLKLRDHHGPILPPAAKPQEI